MSISFTRGVAALAMLAGTSLAQGASPVSSAPPAASSQLDCSDPANQLCYSYGMDFQDQGDYFQNSGSTDPFTFVSQFEGCQNDTAINLLVDPSGDEYQCTSTDLQPDDTDMLSTCPIDKNQLVSGDWSIIIISNNGDACPIAYERDFYLSVGPQSTSTYTPTITITSVTTPIATITSTETDTDKTTLKPKTVTEPSTTIKRTVTITPKPVFKTTTDTLLTIKTTKYKVSIVKSFVTKTASCVLPTKPSNPDPWCTITPTIVTAAALETNAAKAKFRRRDEVRYVPADREQRIRERKERLAKRALDKRAPDPQPLVVTDTNTSDYPTTTTTSTTTTSSVTVSATITVTKTFTPYPVTVINGRSTAPVVTKTAPRQTKTKTKYTVVTTATTKVLTTTVTITKTRTPAAVKSACKSAGGTFHNPHAPRWHHHI